MTSIGPRAGDFLRLSAERFPDRDCLVAGDGTRWTFTQTNARVNQVAQQLIAAGVGRGDRVAIFAVNSIGYAEVLFACLKVGCTYVPLNNRLTTAEVGELLGVAKPRVLFTEGRYADLLTPTLDHLDGLVARIAFDGAVTGYLDYESWLAQGLTDEPDIDVDDDDILGLAFTSGTTGRAKGVLQSQRMIKNLVTAITLDYEIEPDEFRYSSSPMFHIGGQSPVFMHAWRGFPTLILPAFDVDAVLSWMQTGGLTGCFLVPTMISTLLEDPRVRDADYAQLRSIIYGAAPMPPTVLRRAIDVFGCEFVNAFGAGTETGLQTVLGSADHRRAAAGVEHLLGSIGKPAYGVDLRLFDEDGQEVAPGEVGEIVTRNAQTMSGYLDLPEETAKALADGWFRAGDLAYRDAEGYLYLAGRRNDMIIRGGENIYPIEIEDALCLHLAVAEAAVVGGPDEHWGEIVVAFVVLRAGAGVGAPVLQSYLRGHLAAYKVPSVFVFVDELPINASGKVMRRDLRERYAAQVDAC